LVVSSILPFPPEDRCQTGPVPNRHAGAYDALDQEQEIVTASASRPPSDFGDGDRRAKDILQGTPRSSLLFERLKMTRDAMRKMSVEHHTIPATRKANEQTTE
jgi:hypothetical protein